MAWRKRLKYDFVAEASAGRDRTATEISESLRKEWDLTTEPEPPDSAIYVSMTRKPSFRRAILEAIPAHIEWEVATTAAQISEVRMNFKLPLRLHTIMCVIMLAFFLTFHFVAIFVEERSSSSSIMWNLMSLVMWLMYILCVIFFIKVFASLRIKYQSVTDFLVSSTAKRLSARYKYKSSYIGGSSKGIAHELVKDLGPVIILVIIILTQVTLIIRRSPSRYIEFSSTGALLSISAILLLFLALCISWACLRGHLLGKVLLPSATNTLIIACLFLILVAPILVQEGIIRASLVRLGYSNLVKEFNGIALWRLNSERTLTPLSHAEAIDRAKTMATLLCFLPVYIAVFGILGFTASIGIFRKFVPYATGIESEYQQSMVETSKSPLFTKANPSLDRILTLSSFLVWIQFFLMSGICWFGVILNMSVVSALTCKNLHSDYFVISVMIREGVPVILGSFLQGSNLSHLRQLLRILIVVPAFLPCAVFVLMHIRFWIRQCRSNHSLVHLGDAITNRVEKIAAEMGVAKVSCLLDLGHKAASPYAAIRGVIPHSRIVFGKETLRFLDRYPHFFEAVIAHEIGHLQRHCHRIRRLTIISRLGLVGVGLLAMTLDSLKIEDEADSIAHDYLVKAMKEKADDPGSEQLREKKAADLIGQAAYAMNVWRYPKESDYLKKLRSHHAAAYVPNRTSHSDKTHNKYGSALQKVKDSFNAAHYFYFELELYHYLHRNVRLRRSRLLEETR